MLSVTLLQLLIGLSAIVLQASCTTRIVGGENTTIDQYPFMVSINADGFLCGGVLIRSDVVLSAAHCFSGINASNVEVKAGSTTLLGQGVKSKVNLTIIPTEYDNTTKLHDIALLKLQTPLEGPQIGTILLPGSNVPSNVFMTALGWGHTSENGNNSNTLRAVNLKTVSPQQCWQLYHKPDLFGGMFCAISSGKDACKGDSGGPLLHRGIVYGITSKNGYCARPNKPGVYTNVFLYLNWIANVLNFAEFKQ